MINANKKILILLALLFTGCNNYQVVSEIKVNLYHLQNPKTKKIEVILTKEKLEVGKFYNIKRIKQINLE